MEDEPQVFPLDLSINGGVLHQNNEEDTTGQAITEPQSEPPFTLNVNDLVTSSYYAGAQAERQLVLCENENQANNPEELDSADRSHTEMRAKLVIGSPDCTSCNNTRYFESIIANIEKKIEGLKKSMKNKEGPVESRAALNVLSLAPSLDRSLDLQERLFNEYQARDGKPPLEYYNNYYSKETRRSEIIKIYDLGNVDGISENVKQNLNEFKVEKHNDIRIVSTVKHENLQSQYLVPQLYPNPIVFKEPSKYVPIAPRNENWVSSANVELNAYRTYFLDRNTQVSDLNSRYAAGNVLPEEPNYRQPVRMGFSTKELDELLTEIHNIEAYVQTMDKDVKSEAYSIERFCPEYWAFLTNRLVKIKTQQYLLNGFNDTYCDKILSRVNTLGKFPQEYWCPVYRPPTAEGCSRYVVPQKEDKPKIILKLSRNVKERRRYTRGGRGRQRRKNPEGSWSIMQPETSDQPPDAVQTAEVSTGNDEEEQ